MFEKKIKKDYLKLAQIVYGGEFYLELKNYKLAEVDCSNSKFEKVIDSLLNKKQIKDFYSYKNLSSGFVANLFENIKTKELVIAYRGTERIGLGENTSDISAFMKDVLSDVNMMTATYDEQFKDAWDFYKIVKKQNPKRKIVIVGQSLGGALAQIVPAKEYTINRKKIETYTFNAPGCKHLLDTYDCNLSFNYSFITNYSVMNDWCGMFGEHIGQRYLIAPIPMHELKSNSTIEIINNILLLTHEGIFDYSEEEMGKVYRKPKNFNQKEGLSLWYFDKNNPVKNYPNMSTFINTAFPQFNISQNNNSLIQKAENFLKENIPENAMSIMGPGIEAYIPLKELIDKEAELNRLDREKIKVTTELSKLNGMLGNEGFINKAPSSKVEEIRNRVLELNEILAGIEKRIEALR